jgi:hypothetical protein
MIIEFWPGIRRAMYWHTDRRSRLSGKTTLVFNAQNHRPWFHRTGVRVEIAAKFPALQAAEVASAARSQPDTESAAVCSKDVFSVGSSRSLRLHDP